MHEWTLVTTDGDYDTHRMKVKGGHIYRCTVTSQAATTQGVSQLLSMVFVPNEKQRGIVRGNKTYEEIDP